MGYAERIWATQAGGRPRRAVAAGDVVWKLPIFMCTLVTFAGVVPVWVPAIGTPPLTKTRHEQGRVITACLTELMADADKKQAHLRHQTLLVLFVHTAGWNRIDGGSFESAVLGSKLGLMLADGPNPEIDSRRRQRETLSKDMSALRQTPVPFAGLRQVNI